MVKSYYLSDGSKTYGPFSKKQVHQLLTENKISIFQLIFEDESQVWIQLYQHPDFTAESSQKDETPLIQEAHQKKSVQKTQELFLRSEDALEEEMTKIQSQPVQVPSGPSALRKNSLDFWEVKTEMGVSSPRSFLKMLEAIESNSIQPNHLIRKVGQKKWTEASLCDEFSESYIEKANNTELTQVQIKNENLLRRKHERKDYRSQILFIIDGKIEFTESLDVSLGGLAFISQNPNIIQSQMVKIFLKKNQGKFDSDFYMLGRVVSLKKEGHFFKIAISFEHIPYGFADWYNSIS